MQDLSIVIPTKNRPRLLERAVAPLRAAEVEVIVVDDGSSPPNATRNKAICEALPGCRYRALSPSLGAPAARNLGFRMSRGDWVWFIDDDDRASERTVTDVLAAIHARPKQQILLLPQRILLDSIPVSIRVPADEADKRKRYRDVAIEVNTSCTVFQREVLVQLGGWDESLYALQDTDLLLRAADNAGFACVATEPVDVDASHARISYSLWVSTIGKLQFLHKHWRILPLRRRLLFMAHIVACTPMTRKLRLRWAGRRARRHPDCHARSAR